MPHVLLIHFTQCRRSLWITENVAGIKHCCGAGLRRG